MRPLYQKIIADYSVAKVLDVGCGNGHFSKTFIENKIIVDGVDGHQGALNKCRELGYRRCYFTSNIDEDSFDAIEENYDLIVCKDFLEHILFPQKVLQEMAKRLSPGGKVFVHVPNHFPLWFRLKFLFSGKIDIQNFFPEHDEWNNPHIRFFSFDGMVRLFDSTGYKVSRDYSDYFFYSFPHGISIMKKLGLSKVLYGLFPSLFTTGFTFLIEKK